MFDKGNGFSVSSYGSTGTKHTGSIPSTSKINKSANVATQTFQDNVANITAANVSGTANEASASVAFANSTARNGGEDNAGWNKNRSEMKEIEVRSQESSKKSTDKITVDATEQTPLLFVNGKGQQKPKQDSDQRGKAQNQKGKNGEWLDKYKELLLFALRYASPSSTRVRFFAFSAFLLRGINSGSSIITPLALKASIDSLSLGKSNFLGAYFFISAYVALKALSQIILRLRTVAWSRVVREQTRALAVASFAHIHQMSLGYLYGKKIGRLSSLADRGNSAIMSLMGIALFDIFPMLLETIVVTTVLIKFKSPDIAVVIFVSVLIYIAVTVVLTPISVKFREAENEMYLKVSHKKWDSLGNFETVKYFGAEERESNEYAELLVERNDIEMKKDGFSFWSEQLKEFISKIGLYICLCLSVRSVVKGDMSAGSLVAVNTYFYQLFRPLTNVGRMYRDISKRFVDLQNFVDFVYTEPEIRNAPNAYDLSVENEVATKKGTSNRGLPMVEFQNVTFSYEKEDTKKIAVRNISFEIPRGRMTAFVGPSGAGKSTIIKLLLRLFDVDDGRVLINGQDVRDVTISSIRDTMGIVAQDTVLFNDTLRFNISYGKQDATDAEIFAAAEMAALGGFIKGLPEGLDTICGERGVRLSGGERQRVGIARCLIKNPSIIILDESTGSLDTLTEREIQSNLAKMCETRTVVAIAHRLSTIMMADEILVVHDGQIIERGNHAELLNLGPKGVYAQMWGAQVGSFIGEIDAPSVDFRG